MLRNQSISIEQSCCNKTSISAEPNVVNWIHQHHLVIVDKSTSHRHLFSAFNASLLDILEISSFFLFAFERHLQSRPSINFSRIKWDFNAKRETNFEEEEEQFIHFIFLLFAFAFIVCTWIARKMNSVFSAFKSNKSSPTSALSPTSNGASESGKRSHGASKKTLNLNETNNYEKLRHIREKMSNLVIDDDEINLRKPPAIPIASMDGDDCEAIQKLGGGGFDCVDSAPSMNGVNGFSNGNLSSSSSSSSLNTISLASIKKHYNQDNSENYASENNLLSKCCNGASTICSASNVSIVDTSDVNSSASATNLVSINSMPLSDANDASKSASSIFNKQPQPNNSNLSNTNRNRPRLSLSNVGNCSGANQQQQPVAVHGRNNGNGLPTGRTRLSTHQRNLSLDFRWVLFWQIILFRKRAFDKHLFSYFFRQRPYFPLCLFCP